METESRTEMRRHRSCCISREFLSAASSKPDKVAVIHAAGGALRSRRRRLAYDGDECFTYSQLLTAVDSLTARIRNILDGGDDPCLTRPSTSTCSSEHAHNWSSEHVPSSEHLNNVSMQSTEVPVQGKTKTVGVYMFPSVEYIIAVFSILRCGEAFMPLDPSWPNERILSVLSSSNADLILYREHQEPISVHNEHRKSQSVLDSCQWPLLSVSLDQSHAVETGSAQQDLLCPCESRKSRKFSYLMYTSGSTGKPKGVCGTEEGLLNRFWWLQELYPLHKEELLLFKTSISFIDHIQEFLAAMLTACTLVIPAITELRRNISIIIDFVQDYKISRLTATPSLLRAVIPALQTPDHVQICNLKLLVVSGEVFLISLWYKLSELLPQTSILNIYGSTEVSGDCTYFDCKRLPMLLKSYSLNSVPIGRPISNCNVQLMKDTGLLDEGEICVNGICVACGYISENSIIPFDLVDFSECHSANSCFAKSYIRTGDFATRLRNGDLVFLGRKDRTVKVSGQRVALEEIEDTLRRQPAIADAAVVFNNDEGEHGSLRAYFVLKQNNKLDDTLIISIRNWMIERLFTAMIPKELICIEALPLSSSGKVDYSSLCGSLSKNNYSDELVRAESSELIEKIQQAFCHALSAEVGRDDDFFEMGGDSITAAHVAHNLGIDMRLLYSFPTPLKLENALLKKGLTSMFGNQIDWDGLSESNNTNWLSEQSKVISDMNDGLLSSTPIESISFGGISKLLKMDQSLHVFDWNVNLIDMHAWKLNFMPNSCIVSRCNSVVYSGYEKVNDLSQSWAIDWPQEGTGFLQKQWKVHMDSCVDASPVIVFKDQEILLFIGSHSHKFLCVNAKSGRLYWKDGLNVQLP